MCKKWLTVKTICQKYNVSRSTVNRWIKHKGLPVIKNKGRLFFLKDDTSSWYKKNITLPPKGNNSNLFSLVSLFSGGGGLDIGLDAVGFKTLYATDIDSHSCITLQNAKKLSSNISNGIFKNSKIVQSDIKDISGKNILKSIGLSKGEVDLLAGGPPCQAFSTFGKRQGTEDPRGMMVYEYLRILSEVQPKAFVFENVYGLLTIESGKVFEDLINKLSNPQEDLKYTLSICRLNAVDYGVPQFRDRVFIIGSRDGKKITDIAPITFQKPKLPHQLKWRTVGNAFQGLPLSESNSLPNHLGRKHSERIKRRYAKLLPGERDSKTRINKLDISKPSFTIIVGSNQGGGKGHIHPISPREVTPRESARIQTFPDWWAFSGTSRHPIRQVGNAVPPLLASAVGNAIRKDFFEKEKVAFREILLFLGQEHLFKEEIENGQI